MVFALFNSLFCYCCNGQEAANEGIDDEDDENSRLIPDVLEPSIHLSQALVDQQRIQERLGTIVRAKEGKMVNVGSRIPFNLHNQTLPSEVNYTISRSASGSLDPYNYPTEDYDQLTHHQHTYPSKSYPRFSISRSPGPYDDVLRSSRSGSRERETKPILNIRLVGFVDRRGRTRDRKPGQSPDTDTENAATVSDLYKNTGSATTETGQHSIPGILDTFKLQETGAISLSWGD